MLSNTGMSFKARCVAIWQHGGVIAATNFAIRLQEVFTGGRRLIQVTGT